MFCCRLTHTVLLVFVRVSFVTIFVLLAGIVYHVTELERKSSVSLVLFHFHENQTTEWFLMAVYSLTASLLKYFSLLWAEHRSN